MVHQFTFITRWPFWSPWVIKALPLDCPCPSSLTLNERLDGQNLVLGPGCWFGHRVIWVYTEAGNQRKHLEVTVKELTVRSLNKIRV